MSLDALLAEVEKASLDLQIENALLEQTLQEVYITRADLLPDVRVVGSLQHRKRIDEDTNELVGREQDRSALHVQATMPLLNMHSWLRWRAEKQRYRAASQQSEYLKQQVYFASIRLYFEHQTDLRLLRLARGALDRSNDLLKRIRLQKEKGLATDLDLVRMQSLREQDRALLTNAWSATLASRARLNQALNRKPESLITLNDYRLYAGAVPKLAAFSVKQARENRLDLQAAELLLESLDTRVDSEMADYLPKLGLSGTYGSTGRVSPFLEEENYAVGIELSLPIFDGFRSYHQARQSREAYKVQKLRLDKLRLALEAEFMIAHEGTRQAYEEAELINRRVLLAQLESEISRVRFKEGQSDTRELVRALERLAQVERELAVADLRSLFQLLNLLNVTGDVRKIATFLKSDGVASRPTRLVEPEGE